ncbi:VOC family protein [Glaciihabitans sp. dw_435]|uniref:VOC family protein n=1 Tax=Glaciihabitans sp. dw_435 TaxID=2720081 RepID=UPI001BD5115B|nr:VOC family protein [Glaciihabitans sp. dw_435]
MALRLVQVNIKARDDAELGHFWANALGWGISSEGPGVTNLEPIGFSWPDPTAVCIDLVTVPDPETVHYRVYLELATASADHREELITHLTGLGATSAPSADGVASTAFADPEGNVFRVLEPLAVDEETGPIAVVVVASADPREMARFWGGAMDWTVLHATDDLVRLRSSAGVGPFLEFRRGDVPASAVSRIHLDVAPYPGDDQAAEVARLQSLGGAPADVGQGDVPWKVLRDTEGNDFCVLSPR